MSQRMSRWAFHAPIALEAVKTTGTLTLLPVTTLEKFSFRILDNVPARLLLD